MTETTPTAQPSCHVFLSYSRTDPKVASAALAVKTALEQANLMVFKDDQSLRAGDRWVSRLSRP